MKLNRNEPTMLAIPDIKRIVMRLKNRQITMSKAGDGRGNTIVMLTFARFRPWEDEKNVPDGMISHKVDKWMRGESKFNVAISHMAIGEETLANVYDMMIAYEQMYSPRQPQKPIIHAP